MKTVAMTTASRGKTRGKVTDAKAKATKTLKLQGSGSKKSKLSAAKSSRSKASKSKVPSKSPKGSKSARAKLVSSKSSIRSLALTPPVTAPLSPKQTGAKGQKTGKSLKRAFQSVADSKGKTKKKERKAVEAKGKKEPELFDFSAYLEEPKKKKSKKSLVSPSRDRFLQLTLDLVAPRIRI